MLYDPEIEKITKANRKAAQLARSAEPSFRTPHTNPTLFEPKTITTPVIKMGDVDPPPRPLMGDYGMAANHGHHTHVFEPTNPIAFEIKTSVHNGLKENQYERRDIMIPHEHHIRPKYHRRPPPPNVTEDQNMLRLFAFTLTWRAKYWLLFILSGTIQTWKELEVKFLDRFFPMSKYWEKKAEITSFKQGETKSLYDPWERFKFLLKRCPTHDISEKVQMQVFSEGLTHNHKMLLDASAGGSMRVKTDREVQTLVENMSQNEYRADKEKGKRGVFGMSECNAILENQATMHKHLEALTKHVMQQQQQPPQVQQATSLRCDFCGEGHANCECVPEGLSEEVNYMGNFQKGNPYSNNYNPGYARHPNLSYSNTNTLNLLTKPQPQQ